MFLGNKRVILVILCSFYVFYYFRILVLKLLSFKTKILGKTTQNKEPSDDKTVAKFV